jgi:hypothetical protein
MNALHKLTIFVAVVMTIVAGSFTLLHAHARGNVVTGMATGFVYIPPAEITESAALDALLNAEEDIKEVSSLGISTFLLKDTLLIAKRYFIGSDPDMILFVSSQDEVKKEYLASLVLVARTTPTHELKPQNFSEVIRLTQLIDFQKEQAYKILDMISLAEEKEAKYRGDGIDTAAGLGLVAQAKKSLLEERFDEAEALLEDANLRLDQARLEEVRFRNIFKGTANFFQQYWWQSLIVFIVLAISSPYLYVIGRKAWAVRKLSLFKKEQQALQGLLVKAQEDCFKYRTITSASYNVKADSYKARMNEIQRTIPVLESIISGVKKKAQKEEGSGLKIK